MKISFPNIAQYRLRILFRGAFLLLAVATVALALYVLQQEKQLSYKNYQASFRKTGDQILATLRHPAGQLALLNPRTENGGAAVLHPVLLPFPSLDFDDQNKVRQAITMSGCLVQYGDDGALCVAVGNNPWAGGFIYVAGSFVSGELMPHQRGEQDIGDAHRVRVTVTLRGQTYRWIAPFEKNGDPNAVQTRGAHGRLTGFLDDDSGRVGSRPVKDFRGWIWQSTLCSKPGQGDGDADCPRSSFFSLRLPVGVLQDALFQEKNPVWPPADLDNIQVRIEVLPPGDGPLLFDSKSAAAARAFSVGDLASLLLPGESLRIRKRGAAGGADLVSLTGAEDHPDDTSRLLSRLVRRLPVDEIGAPNESRESVVTSAGIYDVTLIGDERSVNRSLGVVAARVLWFVGAMLLALFVAWLIIEIGIIRRITMLTRRAAKVSKIVKGSGGLDQFNLTDLRGADELGVLASCLHDLLRRVKEDVEREEIRAEQEKEMWHAVGHEIMSPLQSLMALHGTADSQSSRYINRMQQAVRVLYGSASPSEAFQSTVLQVTAIDIGAFLGNVADNAPLVGIADVRFFGGQEGVMVRADDYSLEDVVTHVLRNADRCRQPGSMISIDLKTTETAATIAVHNYGPNIAEGLIDKIFEYGVSDQFEAGANGSRGQGLFVAKTYMAKMGGTITALNVADGVVFSLGLQRV
ncbi:sensor histidine kinase KdpD [Collimonas sp. OK412]|jgi:signal transduction histidine kinase|uniref:sensor histidine kinase n=1 Tax=Collimonas sp. (strain OK412) TaxID=1801619 RepID=UPI0008E1AADA|nr:HAMP domain-containing sensor histidine kinase [Collimonas sp. OK412]SFD15161.1 Signal transduction histidine kinase [Collimonas sp. OK412]